MRGLVLVLALSGVLVGCSPDTPAPIEPEVAGISGAADGIDHWFAAADASPGGNGTREFPWTLDSAMAGGRKVGGVRPVGPGDTVWIAGGVYRGRFRATRGGEPGAPVVFIAEPGSSVVLDGNDGRGADPAVLTVQSDWIDVRELEITTSAPVRTAQGPYLVYATASHLRFMNLVLHDGGTAFFNDPVAADVEITGSLIYHNGWFAGGKGHGHGLYLKSNSGPVTARDNVIFNQFGYGVHAYSDSHSSGLVGVRLFDNVIFNNSTVQSGMSLSNIIIGGTPANGIARGVELAGNLTFFAPGTAGPNVRLGFDATRNSDVSLRGNVIAGGAVLLETRFWDSVRLEDDTLIGDASGASRMVLLLETALARFQWQRQRYFFADPAAARWRVVADDVDLALWRSRTSFAADDAVAGPPPERVRVHAMGPGRAAIAVLHSAAPAVTVTLPAGVLAAGDSFQVRNVQRLSAGPVTAGRYAGTAIDVPLAAVTPDRPRSWSSAGPGTGTALHVLLLEKIR